MDDTKLAWDMLKTFWPFLALGILFLVLWGMMTFKEWYCSGEFLKWLDEQD
jgi:uncharacterized integral membrane protein